MAAVDSGTTASQGALFGGQSLTKPEAIYEGGPSMLSVGISYFQQKRDMTAGDNDAGKEAWKVNHALGYLGYDVLSWLTVEAGAGQGKISAGEQDFDADFEWMAGAQVRLMDYLALDPVVGQDPYWVGLNGQLQYLSTSTDGDFGGDVEWNEFFGAVTLSLTSRPEIYGFVNRVGIYMGPAFSKIDAKQGGQDFDEDSSFGFIGGLTVNPSDNLTLKFELQGFGQTSFGASLGFHF
jgi:opacity protein-like surface antigen